MSVVAPGLSTYAQIEQKVRFLTASASEQALPTAAIQQYVNDVYATDFPYGIKVDQMRSVYTFFTRPFTDRYPLDVQYNQGVRAPLYIDGVQGYFYKDRDQFFRIWPRWPQKFQFGQTSPMGSITFISQANPGEVTAPNHGLTTGQQILIESVTGMTQVNGQVFGITVVDANHFTIGVDTLPFTPYISGGNWFLFPIMFSTTVQGPFLDTQVTIGGTDFDGNPITISDDGTGNLYSQLPNPIISVPPFGSNFLTNGPPGSGIVMGNPIPGMFNRNLTNPGLNKQTLVGTVNYVTGVISFAYPLPLQPGTTLDLHVSQYRTGRPFSVLFWNNEFTIRPIPKRTHRVEIEVYLTPVQFMLTTDNPILRQWWKYIALLAARQILTDRQDMEGVANTEIELKRQEGLVLERQATEEIDQRNVTIFAGSQQNLGWNNGFMSGWY